ncbi:uncharacterized protein FTOL_13925 [Fusarium torulosum]|uniref:Uncharacterized protein n=1 Tax=Fusarium torulosum TaxID=33205 RepID=A0AAE8MND5_9HYPO|nr:uncharacterized protein FTOL_13925 [Fusarium torulosum]
MSAENANKEDNKSYQIAYGS